MLPEKHKIADGIFLSVIQTDKFKSSVFSVSLTHPRTLKSISYNYLLAGLLRRGTKTLPSAALLNRALDDLYGSYLEIKSGRFAGNTQLSFVADILDNKYIPDNTDILSEMINIIAELLLEPAMLCDDFKREYFEHERKILLDNYSNARSNTRLYASMRCGELLRRNDPKEPTLEDSIVFTEKASFEDITEHYRYLLSNSELDIFYVGSLCTEEVKDKILCAFANYTPPICQCSVIPPQAHVSAPFIFKSEQLPVSQGKLSMALSSKEVLNADSHGCCTAIMLDEIFGASSVSKLFMNIREKMGLCYYCSSSYSLHSGIISVSCGIDSTNLDIVQNAVMSELYKIADGEISDFELKAAQKAVISSYTQLTDSPFDLKMFYGGRLPFGIYDSIDDFKEKLMQVTTKDISELAKRITLDAVFFVEGTSDAADTEDCDE